MPKSIRLPQRQSAWAPPEVKPLFDSAGQAWLQRGPAEEDNLVHTPWAKLLAVAALLGIRVLWTDAAHYQVLACFIVVGCAVAGMTLFLVLTARSKLRTFSTNGVIAALFMVGAVSAAPLGDLSKYRNFHLGSDVATVSSLAGLSLAQPKPTTVRPASIQELEWSPQPLGPSSQAEAAKTVLFTFYNDQLFQITVNYDRYQTEGLTADDIIEALSAANGAVATHPVVEKALSGSYNAPDDVVARWEDEQYRIDLIREPYGSVFRLVATLKRLEWPVKTALLEAKRLDDQEAPQREAARIADEAQSERARLEKVRLLNKPKFRP